MMEYVGNPLQTRGAEEYTLHGGRGEGMRFLYIRNGLGLELWLSLDRAGDPSRVIFAGDNMGYFAPCGYVAPQYYDGVGTGFLRSFTAGFFTTCGLTAVGTPCTDAGETLPLHGTVSHIPAQLLGLEETESGLTVRLQIRDEALFGRRLVLDRVYTVSYETDRFSVQDTVTNAGDTASPYMILYHCNMGYPLLNEHSLVRIPHVGVTPRNAYAGQYIETARIPEKPQAGYEERCYYYDMAAKDSIAQAGIYDPERERGLVMRYDTAALPCFTEWKLMGRREYVLGLEPGNCTPDGRDVLRKNGTLRFLDVGESGQTWVDFRFIRDRNTFERVF